MASHQNELIRDEKGLIQKKITFRILDGHTNFQLYQLTVYWRLKENTYLEGLNRMSCVINTFTK